MRATGQGDRDGDGLSDGEEVADHCDPLDADSDHDGVDDGDDSTPGMPRQEVKAFLDALTCPQVGVPGSLTALGIAVTLDDSTEFEEVACADLATQLATPGSSVFVEVSVVEDSTRALSAAEVEVDHDHGHDDGAGDGSHG